MDTIISVEGAVPSRQAAAKREIREYLSLFRKSISPEEVDISQVMIAADFEDAVNRALPGLVAEKYNFTSQHRTGKAVGKTLPAIEGGDISFTVIIDGGVLGGWKDNEKATRFEILFHEFFHAFIYRKRFTVMGIDSFRNDYRTIEGVCFSLALTRDEYIVDSFLDVLCKKSLYDENNVPYGLNRLNLERGTDYLAIFSELVNGMPGFIDSHTTGFKTGQKSMSELWNGVCSYIEEILTVFAHLAASREKESDWDSVKKTVSGLEPYQQYLAGHLKKIYTEWVNYFLDGYDEAKSLAIIQNEIQEIFHKCGLSFKNVKDGIHITVA